MKVFFDAFQAFTSRKLIKNSVLEYIKISYSSARNSMQRYRNKMLISLLNIHYFKLTKQSLWEVPKYGLSGSNFIVAGLNTGKYKPIKICIWKLFMQWIGSSKFLASSKFANVTPVFKLGSGELKTHQHPTYYLKNIWKAHHFHNILSKFQLGFRKGYLYSTGLPPPDHMMIDKRIIIRYLLRNSSAIPST